LTDLQAQPQPVCDLCHLPAAWRAGHWEHAEPADAAFCAIVMRGMTIQLTDTKDGTP